MEEYKKLSIGELVITKYVKREDRDEVALLHLVDARREGIFIIKYR